MAGNILKKEYLDINVVEAARQRIIYLMRTYDKVVVNFSGGKDSTALLYVAIEAAKEINKLPVEAVYVDHEIEGKNTLSFIDEVANMKEVNFIRYCLPFKLRNAASFYAPEWHPWNPLEKKLWLRDIPKDAVTQMDGHYFNIDKNYTHPDGMPFRSNAVISCSSFQDLVDLLIKNYEKKGVTAIALVGIRAQESMARYTIMTRKKSECYISSNSQTAYPIYDMLATDVWKYIRDTGLPYNKEYDLMNKTEHYNKLNKQRVGSVFAEESLRTLHQWREFYGDYWHKILERAEGIKTAWRYCNSDIYTGTKIKKEDNVSWSEYTSTVLSRMPARTRALVKKSMKKIVVWHKNQTDYPIPQSDIDANPLTGISWEFLARIAIRGDTKERNLQKVPQMSQKARKRNNLTRDEAVNIYGSEKYKKKYYDNKKTKNAVRKAAMDNKR